MASELSVRTLLQLASVGTGPANQVARAGGGIAKWEFWTVVGLLVVSVASNVGWMVLARRRRLRQSSRLARQGHLRPYDARFAPPTDRAPVPDTGRPMVPASGLGSDGAATRSGTRVTTAELASVDEPLTAYSELDLGGEMDREFVPDSAGAWSETALTVGHRTAPEPERRGPDRAPSMRVRLVTDERSPFQVDAVLGGERIGVGRAPDNDIVLPDDRVWPHHVTLRRDASDTFVSVNADTGPVAHNGRDLEPGATVLLTDGDKLTLAGAVHLEVLVDDVAPQAPLLKLLAVGRTTPGRRPTNEDAHLATVTTIAVADGVGGLMAGEVAAAMAIDAVATRGRPAGWVENDATLAHHTIIESAGADPRLTGMATTLDAIRIIRVNGVDVLDGVHVGDGTVWLCTPDDVTTLTSPHTGPGRSGSPGLAEALGFPGPLHPRLWQLPAEPGHRLVIASDGLGAVLDADAICAVLTQTRADSAADVATRLIRASLDGPDNVTVVVADVVGADATPTNTRLRPTENAVDDVYVLAPPAASVT